MDTSIKNQHASNTERLNPLKLKEFSPELIRVMNLLIYTKKSNVSYSGGEFNTGYHRLIAVKNTLEYRSLTK